MDEIKNFLICNVTGRVQMFVNGLPRNLSYNSGREVFAVYNVDIKKNAGRRVEWLYEGNDFEAAWKAFNG